MDIEFAKLNGLGNDFVFIDDMSNTLDLSKEEVSRICDRHFGVGADGVILVRRSEKPECSAYMHYINSDGTLAQMCGNGVRCFAKYLVDRDIVDPNDGHFTADTLAGSKPISFTVDENMLLTEATVDMGEPILEPSKIPVDADLNMVYKNDTRFSTKKIDSPWGEFEFVFVSMGNPHAITFINNWNELPDDLFFDPADKSIETFQIDSIGAFFESNSIFPEKSNIEFAQIAEDGIAMRVYERGCGETLACGTGACGTSVAASLCGLSGRNNRIHLKGGILDIRWDERDHVMMTGAAEQSFTGVISIK